MKTTIDKLGCRFPIGPIGADGEVPELMTQSRTFSFCDWTTPLELKIGEIRENNKAISAAQHAQEVLSIVLASWAGQPTNASHRERTKLFLAVAAAADVLTAWLQLRRIVAGNFCTMNLVCPFCDNKFDYRVDLGSIEVETLSPPMDPHFVAPLDSEYMIAGKLRSELTFGEVTWQHHIDMVGMGFNIPRIELASIAAAVKGAGLTQKGFVEEPFSVSGVDLEVLPKPSRDGLLQYLKENRLGPDFGLDVRCPVSACRHRIETSIDSFFTNRISSPSERGKKYGRKSSISHMATKADSPGT